jgi:hypothetical protein
MNNLQRFEHVVYAENFNCLQLPGGIPDGQGVDGGTN